MGVLKSKRKPSDFEVIHFYYQMRREITDLLLRDFGYSPDKQERKISKQFGGRSLGELNPEETERYKKLEEKNEAFNEWFVTDERKAIIGYLRNLGMYIFAANDIRPQYQSELEQRRIYQDRAIGVCDALKQELQYIIETLPVDINKYMRFADMIEHEMALIKAWRKSDNKFKKIVEKTE